MTLCGVICTPLMAAENTKPLRVLASLPITYGLGEVLLKGTDVSLERAAPPICQAVARPRISPVAVRRR